MTEARVLFHSMEEIQKFVAVTSGFPERLDLLPQNDDDARVSGKSVMGIFSLDYTHPLRLRIHAEEGRAGEICKELKAFLIS